MVTAEIEKSTSYRNSPVYAGLYEDKPIEALKVGYDAAKEVKNVLFSLVGEMIFDTIQQEKMISPLMRSFGAFMQSYRFMHALSRQDTRCLTLIMQITVHVKRQTNKTKKEIRFAQRLQKQFLKITYQSQLETSKRWKQKYSVHSPAHHPRHKRIRTSIKT